MRSANQRHSLASSTLAFAEARIRINSSWVSLVMGRYLKSAGAIVEIRRGSNAFAALCLCQVQVQDIESVMVRRHPGAPCESLGGAGSGFDVSNCVAVSRSAAAGRRGVP